MNVRTAQAVMLVAIMIFALDNIILKLVPEEYPPIVVMMFSFFIAAPILTIIFRKNLGGKLDKKQWKGLFIVSIFYQLYNVLNLSSLRFLSIDTATFIFSTSIIFVPIIDLMLGAKLRSNTVIGIALIVGGFWILSGISGMISTTGVVLSILAAIVRSFYVVGQNRIVKDVDSRKSIVFLVWSGGFILLLGIFAYDSSMLALDYSFMNFLPVLLFSLTSIVMATTLYIVSQGYLTPTACMVMLSTQIVFTLIFTWMIPSGSPLHEDLSFNEIIGALLIIGGNLVINLGFDFFRRHRKSEAT